MTRKKFIVVAFFLAAVMLCLSSYTLSPANAADTGECTHSAVNGACFLCGTDLPVSLTIGTSVTHYADIGTAWAAIPKDGTPATLTLLADVVSDVHLTLDEGSTLIFDGGGHTFTSTSPYCIVDNYGILTIQNGVFLFEEYGDVLINNGTLSVIDSSITGNSTGIRNLGTGVISRSTITSIGSDGINNTAYGSLSVSGCEISGITGISNYSNELTVTDCVLNCNTHCLFNIGTATVSSSIAVSNGDAIRNDGTLTMENMEITGSSGIVCYGGATLVVSESTITGLSYYGIQVSHIATITDCTITGLRHGLSCSRAKTTAVENCSIYSEEYGIYLYGGTLSLSGRIELTGGSDESDCDLFLADDIFLSDKSVACVSAPLDCEPESISVLLSDRADDSTIIRGTDTYTLTESDRSAFTSSPYAVLLDLNNNRLYLHGHKYGEPQFVWAEDHSGCTAITACDCGHQSETPVAFTATFSSLTLSHIPPDMTIMIAGYDYFGQMVGVQIIAELTESMQITVGGLTRRIFFLERSTYAPLMIPLSVSLLT